MFLFLRLSPFASTCHDCGPGRCGPDGNPEEMTLPEPPPLPPPPPPSPPTVTVTPAPPEYEVESKTSEIRDLREHASELDRTMKQRNQEIERLVKKTKDLDKELSVRRNATDVNSELSDLLLNKDNHIQVPVLFINLASQLVQFTFI